MLNKTFNYQAWAAQIGLSHFKVNAPLKELNHFKTGGTAALLAYPQNEAELKLLLKAANADGLPFFILGGGSNVLIGDEGLPYLIINLQEMQLIPQPQTGLYNFAAGTKTSRLAKETAEAGLAGLQTFYGLPGTLGGACYMNARCYGRDIAAGFAAARCFTYTGEEVTINFNPSEWGYKKSPFQGNNLVIVEVYFNLQPSANAALLAEAQSYYDDRVTKGHFAYPSAGSTFKNNPAFGAPSGQIIDSLGLKGFKYGEAMVSPCHANFIVNAGNATSSEILQLIKIVQAKVKMAYGYELEPEVIVKGFSS
ncbi:MAG: UDP-N-acetylmuramate dehydrogenase [Spirochaetaceae bacterium]|nr:UDP-N-acetylmuramate dehydrogenase [Spirochaetaceae bacterium]